MAWVPKAIAQCHFVLAERGLDFRGTAKKIESPNNRNLLGILELLANYNPILNEHLNKVCSFQDKAEKIQMKYLSHVIQDELISLCAVCDIEVWYLMNLFV